MLMEMDACTLYLAKLLQPQEEEAVLLLCPGDACIIRESHVDMYNIFCNLKQTSHRLAWARRPGTATAAHRLPREGAGWRHKAISTRALRHRPCRINSAPCSRSTEC